MNSVEECFTCKVVSSATDQVGVWHGRMLYACDTGDCRRAAKAQLGNLRKSDSALANAKRNRKSRDA